jgi:hypothetical protein
MAPMGRRDGPLRAHKVRALAASGPHFYAYVVAPEPYVVRTPIGHLSGYRAGQAFHRRRSVGRHRSV